MGDVGASIRPKLADLYAQHAPAATRLAYLLTGDTHLAEDLVQDAFVRVAGRFQHLRASDAFGGYLRSAVVNLSRGHFRRKQVERRFLQREGSRAAPLAVPPPDVEEQDELWRALRQLPERQRAALVLRFYEDLPEYQAAELMECSPEALRSLVARGMKALRAQIRSDQT